MRIEAIAAARIAAGEIDEMDGNVVFDGGADDSRMRGVIVFVRAKDENRFRQRIYGEFKLIARDGFARGGSNGNFHCVDARGDRV